MKKLLLITLLTFGFGLNAQILLQEDSSFLNVGNIGTDLTGATPGQGGWRTQIATSAVPAGMNSDFQIVDKGGVYGNALQISGPGGTNGTRFLFKGDLPATWTTRTAGNDILEVECSIFTGPASTSRNSFRIYIYSDEATTKPIVGIGITKNATVTTSNGTVQTNYQNLISGYAHYTSGTTTGFFSFGLGASTATPQVTTTDNTWVRLGFSFNKTTGQVIFKGPGINGSVQGAAAGLDPREINFLGAAGNTAAVGTFPAINNASSAIMNFDNLIVRASLTDTPLSIKNLLEDSNIFSVFPNPANDFINISNSENIKVSNIKITDLNGRVVKQNNFDNVSNINLNVSDLSSGVYMMNINTNEGSTVKKIIKN